MNAHDGVQTTVLLAEDEPMVRNLIHSILAKAGYNVLEAADGEEALQLARAHAGHIDLLLSDVVMPRMDGLTLAARLSGERPGTSVLLISGNLPPGLDAEASVFPLLKKPFLPAHLLRKIRDLVEAPGMVAA